MPFPWAAAAKVIPWGEVIAAAPGIVRGARDLWQRARGAPAAEAGEGALTPEQRIAALQGRLGELDTQLEASSRLIAQLAEQNQRLVVAIDRLKRQATLAAVLAASAVIAALAALLRG